MRFSSGVVVVFLLWGAVPQVKGAIGPRGSARHQGGEEPGYEESYSRFGAFVPLPRYSSRLHLLYGDLQVTLSNESVVSGSIGFGGRVFLEDRDLVLGLNSYWDRRDYGQRHQFDQYGFGFELLGPVWGTRANLYLNSSERVVDSFVANSFYTGENLVFEFNETVDESLQGVDVEIARLFETIPAEAAVGLYHLQGSDGQNQATGVMGRAQVWLTRRLAAFGSLRNDGLFGTTGAGGVVWYFDGSSTVPHARSRFERLAVPVERQYNVPVARCVRNASELARDPASGTPITFTHVDGSAPGGGNGTYEQPFDTINAASNSGTDVVLVQPGTYSADSITMSADQRLLAASRLHSIATQQGVTALPETGVAGVTEILNAPVDAITIANNTEVSGFAINNPGQYGITGTDVTGYNINANNVYGGSRGIYLAFGAVGNSGDITGNSITGSGTGVRIEGMSNGTVSGNTASGNGSGFDFTLFGGTISDNTAVGNTFGFAFHNIAGGTASGNTAQGNATGFYLSMRGGTVSGNTASNNTSDGFYMWFSDPNTGTFQGNLSNNNTLFGYRNNTPGTDPAVGVGTNTGSGNSSNDTF